MWTSLPLLSFGPVESPQAKLEDKFKRQSCYHPCNECWCLTQLEESDGYGSCLSTCFCLGYHSTGASCFYGPTRDVELEPLWQARTWEQDSISNRSLVWFPTYTKIMLYKLFICKICVILSIWTLYHYSLPACSYASFPLFNCFI